MTLEDAIKFAFSLSSKANSTCSIESRLRIAKSMMPQRDFDLDQELTDDEAKVCVAHIVQLFEKLVKDKQQNNSVRLKYIQRN